MADALEDDPAHDVAQGTGDDGCTGPHDRRHHAVGGGRAIDHLGRHHPEHREEHTYQQIRKPNAPDNSVS